MKKEKEFVEAEIVTDNLRRTDNFKSDFYTDQFSNIKKTLLLKGGFFVAFWIIIILLILAGVVALIF